MPLTDNRAYRYPNLSSGPDVPLDIEQLARDVDADMNTVAAQAATAAAQAAAAVPARKGLPSGTDWNTLYTTAVQEIPYSDTSYINVPVDAKGARVDKAGSLVILNSGHHTGLIAIQTFYGYAGTGAYLRSSGSTGAWTNWVRVDNPADHGRAMSQRAALVSAYKARRGGVIGTSGRIPVSFRIDHGFAQFVTKAAPLFRKYGIPWGAATNPGTLDHPTNAITPEALQALALDDGGELWNHSADHAYAASELGQRAQIIDSLETMKTMFPGLPIEGWMPPGSTGSFGGYEGADTLAKHYDTIPGQMILSHHAAVAGYLPGLYRPLPADLPIGLGHTTIDATDPADVAAIVSGAITARMGVQLMLHPVYLDTAGFMSTAGLETVLANLANLRDTGKIDILTPSGQLLADPSTSHRDDMVTNGQFTEAAVAPSWAGSPGWSVVQAQGYRYATTTTGTPLLQTRGLARKEATLGGTRELVYRVRAVSGAVVRTAVTGTGVNATADHTLPASPDWVEVRKPVTIPLNFTGNLTLAAGRVSGGPVDITDIRFQSI